MQFKYETSIGDDSAYALLLASCSDDWQRSTRVVADSMRRSLVDFKVTTGDMALEERLRHLAEIGEVEIDDPSLRYGKYQVRLRPRSG